MTTPQELIQYQLYGKLPPQQRRRVPRLSWQRLVVTLSLLWLGLLAAGRLQGGEQFAAIAVLGTAALLALVHDRYWIALATGITLLFCGLLVCRHAGWIDSVPRISPHRVTVAIAIFCLGLSAARHFREGDLLAAVVCLATVGIFLSVRRQLWLPLAAGCGAAGLLLAIAAHFRVVDWRPFHEPLSKRHERMRRARQRAQRTTSRHNPGG